MILPRNSIRCATTVAYFVVYCLNPIVHVSAAAQQETTTPPNRKIVLVNEPDSVNIRVSAEAATIPSNRSTVTTDDGNTSPKNESDRYLGQFHDYSAAERGARSITTLPKRARTPLLDTAVAPPHMLSSLQSLPSDNDTILAGTNDTTTETPVTTIGLKGKIILTAGTVLLTGGIVCLIMLKKDSEPETVQGKIPQPPKPPGI